MFSKIVSKCLNFLLTDVNFSKDWERIWENYCGDYAASSTGTKQTMMMVNTDDADDNGDDEDEDDGYCHPIVTFFK